MQKPITYYTTKHVAQQIKKITGTDIIPKKGKLANFKSSPQILAEMQKQLPHLLSPLRLSSMATPELIFAHEVIRNNPEKFKGDWNPESIRFLREKFDLLNSLLVHDKEASAALLKTWERAVENLSVNKDIPPSLPHKLFQFVHSSNPMLKGRKLINPLDRDLRNAIHIDENSLEMRDRDSNEQPKNTVSCTKVNMLLPRDDSTITLPTDQSLSAMTGTFGSMISIVNVNDPFGTKSFNLDTGVRIHNFKPSKITKNEYSLLSDCLDMGISEASSTTDKFFEPIR